MPYNNEPIPHAPNDVPAEAGYAPGTGVLAAELDTSRINTDSSNSNQQSAPLLVTVTNPGSGGSGGGADTQYTDGSTPPANPVGNALVFDNSGAWADVGADHPLPVSANSLPLPTNAAQETGGHLASADSHLANIDAHTPVLGQTTKAGSTSVTIASDQGTLTTQDTNSGAIKSDLDSVVTNTTSLATHSDASTINTTLGTLATQTTAAATKSDLDTIVTQTANIPAKGLANISASMPVNIAYDEIIPVKRNAISVYSTPQTTVGSGNSGDLTVGAYTEIGIDIATTAQAGTSPTIQFFWDRKGSDGNYYPLWQSSIYSVASNIITTSIGAGMAYNQSLGITGRLRWAVGGTATPTWTFSPNVYGK